MQIFANMMYVVAIIIVILILYLVLIRPQEKFRGRAYAGVSQDRRVFDYSDRYPNVPEIS